MPLTVVKTLQFLTDLEGLADVGDSADITVVRDATGNPTGSLEWLVDATGTERARRPSTGQTWETWGVPPGSIVTDLQITGFDYINWNSITSSSTISIRIVDSAGATVHSAGDLINLGLTMTPTGTPWKVAGAGPSRAVNASKQASTTDVRFEITNSANGSTGGDMGMDNIALLITYASGGPPPAPGTIAPLGMFDSGLRPIGWF
jgi:hypothetical protein